MGQRSSLGRQRSRNAQRRCAGWVPARSRARSVSAWDRSLDVAQHVDEELFLGGEVVVHQAGGDARGLGDPGHPHVGQAVAHDAVGGGGEDAVARFLGGQVATVGLLHADLPLGRLTCLTVQSVSDARLAPVTRQGSPASAPAGRSGRPVRAPARSRSSAPAPTRPSGATSSADARSSRARPARSRW